jgi:hypothetical protein
MQSRWTASLGTLMTGMGLIGAVALELASIW